MNARGVAVLCQSSLIAAGLLLQLPIPSQAAESGAIPEAVKRGWNLDPFYQKNAAAGPLPVVSSTNTSDPALKEAAYLIEHMLAERHDILNSLAEQHVKVVVMAH